MTNFNYDNYDDDTKAKYDDGIEFLDDDFSFDDEDDDDGFPPAFIKNRRI